MIILNETIRSDLIVFIALFADLGTIAIAYDNAPYAQAPVEWQLPKIWFISTIMGALLAAGKSTFVSVGLTDSDIMGQVLGSCAAPCSLDQATVLSRTTAPSRLSSSCEYLPSA